MIMVYEATETQFANNGIKVLNPLFAQITKVDNSDYYLEIEDILDNFEYYQKGLIIRVSTPWGFQGFRCDNPVVKNNRISSKAWHLSYDSKNYVISKGDPNVFVNGNCNTIIDTYNRHYTVPKSPFDAHSDILDSEAVTNFDKISLFELFTALISPECFGGHWHRDNFKFDIKASIGQDNGVLLAYNKNIADIKIEENWDNVCTKLLPYATYTRTVENVEEGGTKEEEVSITLDETFYQLRDDVYDIPFTKAVKFEPDFKKEDFANEETYIANVKGFLKAQAFDYLKANEVPKINYTVTANLEDIIISDVGDRVYVKHPKCKLDTDIPLEVISVKYDVIKGKYTSIEFGNFKKEIKNLVQEVASAVKAESNNAVASAKSWFSNALATATAEINSVFKDSNVIDNGNEILVVDTLPKEKAVYCIKVNSKGIGFSKNGIYGTFTSAWTIDGTLDMQAINVINLTASLIKGGTLQLGGANNDNGTFELFDSSNRLIAVMDKSGLTVYAKNGDYVKLNAEEGFAGYNKYGTKIYWADGDVFRMKNAEVENEIKIAGKIKVVPVSTGSTVGVGFVALA